MAAALVWPKSIAPVPEVPVVEPTPQFQAVEVRASGESFW
jgi:hypothetical protein